MKESSRIRPSESLSMPEKTARDARLAGYHVPKNVS